MGLLIFNRKDNHILQSLPSDHEVSLSSKGKYVIPYPDEMDLELGFAIPTLLANGFAKSEILGGISAQYPLTFPYFDYFQINHLESEADFDSVMDESALFPNASAGDFCEVRYGLGDIPNTTTILGREPRAVLEGDTITSNLGFSGNRCLVTQEINISALTSDGLGRSRFQLYWRDAVKYYTKDQTSLSRIPNNGQVNLNNIKGEELLTIAPSNSLRAFISGDNGNTYSEINVLRPFSFPTAKNSVRIAWVNTSNIDVHLLSYTLMY
jgi:hypothetical protein